jgi:hypothetical protein
MPIAKRNLAPTLTEMAAKDFAAIMENLHQNLCRADSGLFLNMIGASTASVMKLSVSRR